MRKKLNRLGFTMAEMLIVVAIIGVLGAVAFVSVINHQRSMERLERDAIAREIFIAAQNHLTMAQSQGYLGLQGESIFGNQVDEEKAKGIYFFAYPAADNYSATPETLLDLMLPYGSIDETVRGSGNSYIIRYNPEAALVMDVFYCTSSGTKYGHTLGEDEGEDEYKDLCKKWTEGQESKRKKYDKENSVLGWYGGAEAKKLPVADKPLEAPDIEVINDETLRVKVTDKNVSAGGGTRTDTLQLIITGLASEVKKVYSLSSSVTDPRISIKENVYTITLDDITTPGLHFANLTGTKDNVENVSFIPGEDITVQAVAFDNTQLTNVAYSAIKTTNSLFEKIETTTAQSNADSASAITAYINNFRHFENLDQSISKVDNLREELSLTFTLNIHNAVQTSDLTWKDSEDSFITRIQEIKDSNGKIRVYRYSDDESTTLTPNDLLLPVSSCYILSYDGVKHSVSKVDVDCGANPSILSNPNGAAGLFGSPSGTLNVSNLVLIDFCIQGAGDAGALAGTLVENSKVENVLAYNSNGYTESANVTSTSGHAGGMIGAMTGGSVTESAAAVYVSAAGGDAGGLIGKADGTAITASYSGGHTLDGVYSDNVTGSDAAAKGLINVIASGNAGGLVGYEKDTTVRYCYSTCSVYGAQAGGLIGHAGGGTASLSYAAGLVKSVTGAADTVGTFIGGGTVSANNCYYVGGINGAMESGANSTTVVAFDVGKTLFDPKQNTDNTVFPSTDLRKDASPYDPTLITTFEGKYAYLTILQMGYTHPKQETSLDLGNQAADESSYNRLHLDRHYGDWMMPVMDYDLFIENAERLTAHISMPADQVEQYVKNWSQHNVYLLVRGETSMKMQDENSVDPAYLVFKLTEDESSTEEPSYAVKLIADQTAIPGWDGPTDWATDATGAKAKRVKLSFSDDKKKLILSIHLDSITEPGGHFAQLFPSFIPGEDLTVAAAAGFSTRTMLEAVADDHEKWTVEKAPAEEGGTAETRTLAGRTNSLFADPRQPSDSAEGSTSGPVEFSDAENHIAAIGNIRHMENLDGAISNVNLTGQPEQTSITINKAKQIVDLSLNKATEDDQEDTDLSWQGFVAAVKEADKDAASIKIYKKDATAAAAGDDLFLPVNPAYALNYDGQGHAITGIVVDTSKSDTTTTSRSAGLFGEPTASLEVSNLKLINFSVTGSADAGALAGTLSGSADKVFKVTNVVAYEKAEESDDDETTGEDESTTAAPLIVKSTGENGSAGGLIGSMSGSATNCVIEKSAAALIVENSNGSAGGLIGSTNGGSVTASYSGGHTREGKYEGTTDGKHYNVTATTGVAGGLIGVSTSTDISNCYSTCSVAGATAGGFVGTATGPIRNCYATGLVCGTGVDTVGEASVPRDGAFAYSLEATNVSGCKYYEIINERELDADGVKVYKYLTPLGQDNSVDAITALDESAATYNAFVGSPSGWEPANPYDGVLTAYYGGETGEGRYSLESIPQLDATGTYVTSTDEAHPIPDFVATHYGDWPAPEIFVVNTPNE